MANALDIAKAKAFSFWVKNTIGTEPTTYVFDDYVEVRFSQEQKEAMMSWLDQQVSNVWTAEPGSLRIRFGDVLFPWALRYVVPAAGAVFLAGYLTNGFKRVSKRR